MSDDVEEILGEAVRARRRGAGFETRPDLIRAVGRAREAGDRGLLVRALKALGQIERDAGRYEAAGAAYEEAVALCREDGDALRLAHTVRHLGEIHREAGRPAPAEECCREALELYRAHPGASLLDLANALRPLAVLWDEAGRTREARELWREARELYAEVGVDAGVRECDERLGRSS